MPDVPAPAAEPSRVSAPIVELIMPKSRVASVDVYRGFVMLLMMAEVLSFQSVSKAFPDNSFWKVLAFHQSHVEWVGASLHDMIQPSFTFLVGVVLPFSLASRASRGSTFGNLLKHTVIRSLILIFLGIFLRSMHADQTYFTFEDTLTQIGLGYTILFLLAFTSRKVQIGALTLILFGYWLAFALYPLPGSSFDYATAGVNPQWEHNLIGFAAHWNMNTNFAWAFDRWFLNLFPRESLFLNNQGGYSTLSFIPTLGTMVLGLFAGQKLKEPSGNAEKIGFFLVTGVALIIAGVVFHFSGVNPIVKRIWTPAWTLFSGGICYLFLTLFYYVIDVRQERKWAFFLLVIGVNSVAAYVLADGFASFINRSLFIHLRQNYNQIFGVEYATIVKGALILVIEWLILHWMFRKKIFIKI